MKAILECSLLETLFMFDLGWTWPLWIQGRNWKQGWTRKYCRTPCSSIFIAKAFSPQCCLLLKMVIFLTGFCWPSGPFWSKWWGRQERYQWWAWLHRCSWLSWFKSKSLACYKNNQMENTKGSVRIMHPPELKEAWYYPDKRWDTVQWKESMYVQGMRSQVAGLGNASAGDMDSHYWSL